MPKSIESYKIEALYNGLRVLEAIADEPGSMLKRVAEKCEMTLSQAFRVAATLELAGYITPDELKRYNLSYKCLRLGNAAGTAVPLIHLAREEMDLLASKTNESISLVVRERHERVTIDLRESPQAIRVSAPIGERLPLHYGGTGPCLLAFGPESEIEEALTPPLKRATAFTETDPVVIRQRLDYIREHKFWVAVQDYADGAFAVAAPILYRTGMAAGAISISGPLMRFDAVRERAYIDLVTQCVASIELKLSQ